MSTPIAIHSASASCADQPPVLAQTQPWAGEGRKFATLLLLVLTLLPACFLAIEAWTWIRNIPRWDEFDTVLDFLVSLDAGAGGREILQRIFAVQNEHRMVVSRSIFAASYWLTGGINFATLAWIGNLFLLGTVALLVFSRRNRATRLRLAALLALLIFQLQQHENLFWGGASIDHFFVVLASVAALTALTKKGVAALIGAAVCGFAATFSLAHGIIVWPVGLLLLLVERRWHDAWTWSFAALGAVATFLLNFRVNPAHRLPGLADAREVGEFWLTLLGSSAALDDVNLAPWLGGALVLATLWVVVRGWAAAERVAVGALLWCIGAMAAVAWGRALLSPDTMPVTSRYYILSSVAWACLLGIVVERAVRRWPGRSRLWLPVAFVAFGCFNVAANSNHLEVGGELARASETAVRSYHRDGSFAESMTSLYPDPARADQLIVAAAQRGIYQLPREDELRLPAVEHVTLEGPVEINDALYFIEEVKEEDGEMRVRGWAFRPDHTTRLGEIAVVFRSSAGLLAFEPIHCLRPDVAEAYDRWDAAYAGFELRIPESELPAGPLAIGVCFDAHSDPEYMMTANTVVVSKL